MGTFSNPSDWPKERWPNFSVHEMKCKETGICFVDESFMDKLQLLRSDLDRPLTITSGYRDVTHPIEAAKIKSGKPGGAHITGKAVDIACDRELAYEVLARATKYGFTGIGIKQKGDGRFLHLDTISDEDNFHVPRPTIWSY
jgi:uncharacterized protein YcbK (DUF882 family)